MARGLAVTSISRRSAAPYRSSASRPIASVRLFCRAAVAASSGAAGWTSTRRATTWPPGGAPGGGGGGARAGRGVLRGGEAAPARLGRGGGRRRCRAIHPDDHVAAVV